MTGPRSAPGWPSTLLGLSGHVLAMSAAFYLLSRTVVDPDLWGHLRFGADILRVGRVEQPDAYSYLTGEVPWINHEWLAEVSFAWVFSQGGARGLIAFKTAASMAIVGVLHWRLIRTGLGSLRAGVLTGLVTLILMYSLAVIRPHLFTLGLFLILLLLLSGAGEGQTRRLWLLPPLFGLWANLHGGFLAGLAVLGVWCAVRGVSSWRGPRDASGRRALLVQAAIGVSACAATLVNPYGWRLLAFLLAPGTLVRPEILEWRPLDLSTTLGGLYLLALGATVLGVALSRRARHPPAMAVLGGLALAPFAAERHLGLAVIGMIILAAEHIADAWNRWRPPTGAGLEADGPARRRLWVAGIATVVACTFVRIAMPQLGCIRLDPGVVRYPTGAVALLRASAAEANLAIEFDWGEYALWHLAPRIRVSIDGRRETAYSAEARRINEDFAAGTGEWRRLLDRHRTDLALLRREGPASNLLRLAPGWALLYEDPVASLFGRDGSPISNRVRGTPPPGLPPDGTGLCFP